MGLALIPFVQCIVFMGDKKRTSDICEALKLRGFPCANIGGDQPQSQRLRAIEQLKDFKIRILVTSDLTSRGLDCDKINLVINMGLPRNAQTYLHRVGRTGRFGTFGIAITFITKQSKESDLLHNFVQTLNSQIRALPKNVKSIANYENYLNYSMALNDESEKKQFEVFEQKQSKNKNKEKIKLKKPSNIIKDIYVQKEQQNALWNEENNNQKKEKKEKNEDNENEYQQNAYYTQQYAQYSYPVQPSYHQQYA